MLAAVTTPEAASGASSVDAHAGRQAAFRVLGTDDVPSDLTAAQRKRIAVLTTKFESRGLGKRRISRLALAAKVRAVHESMQSGNRKWAISALEDLACACLAYAAWIREHGLNEGRRP